MASRRPAKTRVAKPRVPRTRNAGTMTEAGYFGWIRSQLRRMSQRWRPISQVRQEGRRRACRADKKVWGNRIKWVNTCQQCQQWFPNRMLEIDHTPACGSLGSTEAEFAVNAGPFILRLLCEGEHLRRLCKPCHLKITHE